MKFNRTTRRQLFAGLGFLLPNILGFMAFTLVPLVLSFVIAFTDWDILRHNMFTEDTPRFVGLENFFWLFSHPEFWHYLGNTFFLMLGLPFAVAGSLAAALLLTRVAQRPVALRGAMVISTLVMVLSGLVLLASGVPEPGVWFLFGLLLASGLVAGVLTGGTIYRTLFYLPHFTAGVATFVLWKKLYNPQTGPINHALAPVLEGVAATVQRMPGLFAYGLPAVGGLIVLAAFGWQARRLRQRWDDAEVGEVGVAWAITGLLVPLAIGLRWAGLGGGVVWSTAAVVGLVALYLTVRRPRIWGPRCPRDRGVSVEVALSLGLVPLLLLAMAAITGGAQVPATLAGGLEPPNWLGDYAWAKPAIMIMALWAAIGSNNMILYLAGLSSIPPDLYEAADIDGASSSQRFWHITWPQLAPVTFFVFVMGVIYGLQGGFEMARVMTKGGPAGSTTTLSYFIYIEGFETGRLGYASAAAWVLFALVFVLSFLNFRFGNRPTNG
jgi:multiple sugar transport system permease protein